MKERSSFKKDKYDLKITKETRIDTEKRKNSLRVVTSINQKRRVLQAFKRFDKNKPWTHLLMYIQYTCIYHTQYAYEWNSLFMYLFL